MNKGYKKEASDKPLYTSSMKTLPNINITLPHLKCQMAWSADWPSYLMTYYWEPVSSISPVRCPTHL